MYPVPGHLAFSLAGTTLAGLPHGPAIAATVFVDVADKFMSDVFHIAPYGRCWFHTLFSVAVCSAAVWKFKGRAWGLSWMAGHLLHLVGDIGFVPWFYPFVAYDWPAAPNVVAATAQLASETAAGAVSEEGWRFSETVRQVFKVRLIALESIMLASVAAAMAMRARGFRRAYEWPLWCAFALSAGAGILYQFPAAAEWAASRAGQWMRMV